MPREFILRKRSFQPAAGNDPNNPKREEKYDDYFTKLARLIPIEIIGTYITGFNLVNSVVKETENKATWQWVWYALVSLASIFYLIYGPPKLKRWWSFALIYIAFHLWVACLGGPFPKIEIAGMSFQTMASLVSLAYTLAVPAWIVPTYED